MHRIPLLLALTCLAQIVCAQKLYTITADSVKITGCDSAELILENHTQGVKGFLYNTGNGRTVFKKGVVKLNDSLFLIGGDTLKILPANYWSLNGNANTNPATNFIGTTDANPLAFRIGNGERMRLFPSGNLGLNTGGSEIDPNFKLQINGKMIATGDRHILGNLAVVKNYDVGNTGLATGIRIDDGSAPMVFQGNIQAGAQNMFVFNDAYGGIGMDVTTEDESIVRIKSGFKMNNVLRSASVLHINPNYQVPDLNNNPLTVKGIYYNPIMTNLPPGSRHIAMETTSGDVLLGTTMAARLGLNNANPASVLDMNGDANINLLNNQNLTVNVKGVSNWNRGIVYNVVDSDGVSNNFGFKLSSYNGGSKILNFGVYNADWMNFSGSTCTFERTTVFQNGILGQYHTDFPITLQANSANPNPTAIRFYAPNYGSAPIMSIMQYGYVGIGTSSPSAQLHTSGTVRFEGLTGDDSQSRVLVSDASGNLFYRSAASLAGADLMRSSLAVNGPVKAASLILDATAMSDGRSGASDKGRGWPDYVFDSGYKLADLRSVGDFIRLHKHLPGVVSAADVAASGIDVGANQAALLKKIEELTLYAIKQEELISAQSERLSRMERQMADMERRRQVHTKRVTSQK